MQDSFSFKPYFVDMHLIVSVAISIMVNRGSIALGAIVVNGPSFSDSFELDRVDGGAG